MNILNDCELRNFFAGFVLTLKSSPGDRSDLTALRSGEGRVIPRVPIRYLPPECQVQRVTWKRLPGNTVHIGSEHGTLQHGDDGLLCWRKPGDELRTHVIDGDELWVGESAAISAEVAHLLTLPAPVAVYA
jgi:hypothetical protein